LQVSSAEGQYPPDGEFGLGLGRVMAPAAAPMALRAVMAVIVRMARRFFIFDLRFVAFVD
jgi:hypothetical protein